MAKTSRFKNPRTRRRTLTGVMLAVLIVSTVAAQRWAQAQWIVLTDSQQVGDLQFMLPDDWSIARRGMSTRLSPVQVSYVSETEPGQRLTVAELREPAPRPPIDVFIAASTALEAPPPDAEYQWLALPAGGVALVDVWIEDRATPVQHSLLVMTSDARRFWLLHLQTALGDQGDLRSGSRRAMQLLQQLMMSATDAGVRDATQADLAGSGIAAAGLAALADGGFVPQVAMDHLPGDPLAVRLEAEPGPFVHVRLRGVPALADNDSPLGADAALRRMFRHVRGREPDEDELVFLPGPAAGLGPGTQVALLRTTVGMNMQHSGLGRELCYVDLGDGRALLLETIGDEAGLNHADRMLNRIVRRLAPHVEPPRESDIVAQAAARGAALASRTQAAFSITAAEGHRYMLSQVQGGRFGVEDRLVVKAPPQIAGRLERREHTAPAPGRARLTAAPDGPQAVTVAWQTTEAAYGFAQIVEAIDGRGEVAIAYSVRRSGQTLEAARGEAAELEAGGGEIAWSEKLGAGFVPPFADEAWPAASMVEEQASPAVVWMLPRAEATVNKAMPLAWWVAARPIEGGGHEITLRPMMQMDASRLLLNPDGTVARKRWYDASQYTTGSARIDYHAATREQVLDAYPELDHTPQADESPLQGAVE